MLNLPWVSIIIPCRNEEKFIGKCLNSIINNDYSKESLEILVIDGMSEDKTKEIVEKYTKQYLYIKILENPNKFTPFGLNIGVKNARGDIIIRMDAHSTYEKDYISKCIKYLNQYNADNVGGIWKIMPRTHTLINKAIVFASSSIFGAGDAYYRRGYSRGPKWVDTVFGGCYKKEVFERIGLFNENLVRSQDMEFNLRLKKAGGKILLVPEIVSYYYPKSNLKDFFRHNFSDGIWSTYPLKFEVRIFSWRHLVPLFFVSSLILSLFFSFFFWQARLFFDLIFGSYVFLSLFFSVKISFKKGFQYLFLMPIVFATRHFGYGLGSIWGIVKLLRG
ncbi:MAG: glycosyl transferase [Candidatus Nealsonbacteria bacterium CG_4_10_14_0_8_um_filter_37_14]|uniref:Glycosyl transferase n=1 Tax=Candidatus Nealsonbacteria bacterium CG_4_10_14_0_8_um_filter_37_14 TaxID=1974684 RepID=A0A2M7R6W6_9BACT|nr:MAG: glycosyl transferase [Candidatus Nealsonbacteria bacterium CG_4_10_14_0_8_um_filter_37_14]